ncbi:hypothetical protein [Amycolatopsis plumensis]|uniref:Uncharacterized protein n=1 Tax=Amycolatopsis plumensis TaxID=236508 RepID=A0ABV5UCU4_9PSEU
MTIVEPSFPRKKMEGSPRKHSKYYRCPARTLTPQLVQAQPTPKTGDDGAARKLLEDCGFDHRELVVFIADESS